MSKLPTFVIGMNSNLVPRVALLGPEPLNTGTLGTRLYEFMAFKFELHAALSLVGFQNNNRTFPVRERTFGELANGLCECPVVVLKADQ